MSYDIHQKTKQNNKSFSKGVYAILQREQPKDVQEKLEIEHKIFALGTNLKHMRVTWKVLFKLDELDALISKVSQLEGKKLMWALKPATFSLIQHKFLEEPSEGVRLPVTSFLSNIMTLTPHSSLQ